MIGRLQGTIIDKQPPLLILDVAGVGYEVHAPMSTFYQLPEIDEKVTLLTHLVVREDAQLLYGFAQAHERTLFRTLIKVSGVGPKLALTILSGIEPDYFVQCIRNNDSSRLVNIPGIGKKTAERLVIETRDALADWQSNDHGTPTAIALAGNSNQDAISALTTLGYKPNEAKKAVTQVQQADMTSEQIIRLALQKMTQR